MPAPTRRSCFTGSWRADARQHGCVFPPSARAWPRRTIGAHSLDRAQRRGRRLRHFFKAARTVVWRAPLGARIQVDNIPGAGGLRGATVLSGASGGWQPRWAYWGCPDC